MPSLESFEKEKDLNDVSCSPTHDNTTQILPFAGMCFVVSAPKEKKDYLTKKLKEFGATTSSMLLKNKVCFDLYFSSCCCCCFLFDFHFSNCKDYHE